jgi:hypothetical protein
MSHAKKSFSYDQVKTAVERRSFADTLAGGITSSPILTFHQGGRDSLHWKSL